LPDRVTKRLRQAVERRANRRCEYCLCPLDISTDPFTVEHIVPGVRGGSTTLENLALACSGCNGHKYDKQDGYDPVSEQRAPLFHPRQDLWSDHFAWNKDYTHLIGLTLTGRVTLTTLHLNRPAVVNLRRVLFIVGLHPPETRVNQE
jgi:hypothetical protein